MKKKPDPLPTEEHFAKLLNRLPAVAFAARCARRVLPLYHQHHADAAVPRAIEMAEKIAERRFGGTSISRRWQALSAAESAIAVCDHIPPIYNGAVAAAEAASYAASATAYYEAGRDDRGAQDARKTVDAAYRAGSSIGIDGIVAMRRAIVADFAVIAEIDRTWGDKSGLGPAVSPAVFGDMWPGGTPRRWPPLEKRDFYSCFISYTGADATFARRLHEELQARGICCWLDEHQVLPGDDIREAIDLGIRRWDKLLLCASKESLHSWWVDQEIEKALQKEEEFSKGREENVKVIVPLNLDGHLLSTDYTGPNKSFLTRRRAADFTGWETNSAKFKEEIENVVKALRADKAVRDKPPAPRL